MKHHDVSLHEGSSPLARGLHGSVSRRPWPGRIIPARAGFTRPRSRGAVRCEDHPRSRGVYAMTSSIALTASGSSPLARGLLLNNGQALHFQGIIPARAGFTFVDNLHWTERRDHPRSRGVYAAALPGKWIDGGSSPLARGLLPVGARQRDDVRIIPARAGFTSPPFRARCSRRDHPRSRGVYRFTVSAPRTGAGSSPLARGLRGLRARQVRGGRIIPARAGFTRNGRRSGRQGADHPRSRGVYTLVRAETGAEFGSSPLARGLLPRCAAEPEDHGIIPARAGFTTVANLSMPSPADHPRSRGVYVST